MNIGAVSYLFAFAAYLVLTTLLVFSWRGRSQGVWIVLAAIASVVWAGLISAGELGVSLSFEVIQLSELARSGSWCLFLLCALDEKVDKNTKHSNLFRWSSGLFLFLLIAAVLLTIPAFSAFIDFSDGLLSDSILILWVALAIAGMALIEQIFRNSSASQRWAAKFLCLGVGGIFAYDFFMYSDALLFKQVSQNLWEARGIINGMAVPLVAIAIARNPKYELDIHVSRHVVFHTATIVGAGSYLLLMALVGYFIRFYGGTWGSFLQIVFFCGAGLLLLTLLFSDKIRAEVRVFLSKHFFSYKHDYRDEWLKFTKSMSDVGDDVRTRLIRAIAELVESGGGLLWEKNAHGAFLLVEHWEMANIEDVNFTDLEGLSNFFDEYPWVIDFDEYIGSPENYGSLTLPEWLLSISQAWLIVPLSFKADVIGFVLLKRSGTQVSINWEDRDLLKMAGKQAAAHLAQYQANISLVQARQFEAFNQLSAYVVHDLKNILAQQSLIVANAEKHKRNPEFVDDVITTVKNSVERMTRLMKQMRDGLRGESCDDIYVSKVLTEVVEGRSMVDPVPALQLLDDLMVRVDKDQLATVFSHMVQNAQEATEKTGRIDILLEEKDGMAVVNIQDTGVGMSEDFIRDRLFRPFDSTKGLAGMGIGVYESREFVRSLGGDVTVKSQLGSGTKFRIVLPIAFVQ